MRWLNFSILVLILVIVEVSVSRLLGLGRQRILPDLLLVPAVLLALRGAEEDALLACWLLGLAKDLTSIAHLGSYALCFGLLAWLLIRLRELLYGESLMTLLLVTFVGSMLVEQAVWVINILRDGGNSQNWRSASVMMLLCALLSAAVAPYFNWLLLLLQRWLGLPQRRTTR